jgi:hypothetical protein
VVLAVPTEASKALFRRYASKAEDTDAYVDIIVPVSVNLRNAGKLIMLLFVLFAGWFVGSEIGWGEPGFDPRFLLQPRQPCGRIGAERRGGLGLDLALPGLWVVVPQPVQVKWPLAYPLREGGGDFENYVDRWIDIVQGAIVYQILYDHWILGLSTARDAALVGDPRRASLGGLSRIGIVHRHAQPQGLVGAQLQAAVGPDLQGLLLYQLGPALAVVLGDALR